jgi:hypothetical protein
VVLMQPKRADFSAPTNLSFLRRDIGADRVFAFPWVSAKTRMGPESLNSLARRTLDALLKASEVSRR